MMTRSWWVALFLAGCAPKPEAALSVRQTEAIRDSVRAALAAYAERLNAADPDSLGRFYADDPRFVWAADGRVTTRSAGEVRTQLWALAGFPQWHVEYRDTAIVPLAPGVAAVTAAYQMTLRDSAGRAVVFGGALSMVWVHTRSGWRILSGHSSSPPTGRQ